MINSIRQKATVSSEGKIEVVSSELPSGAIVEVIVLIDPPPQHKWPEKFFEKTAGCLSTDPIEREAQGDLREEC